MSSYLPLADHLARRKGNVWEATFKEVENALGRPLPRSAYRYPAWWANQTGPGHSQTQGWRSVGWRTSKLDLERQRVTFERERQSDSIEVGRGPQEPDDSTEKLIEAAIQISGIEDRDAVIAAALREFIHHQAIEAVVAMGGSQPDFEAAPRERPWA